MQEAACPIYRFLQKLSVLMVLCSGTEPDKLVSKASITSQSSTINVKGFSNGILRYPSRDSRNYHFTQLWSPPVVFTIISIVEDSSGNRVMSSPVSLTATFGNSPPTVKMTSPLSGTLKAFHGR